MAKRYMKEYKTYIVDGIKIKIPVELIIEYETHGYPLTDSYVEYIAQEAISKHKSVKQITNAVIEIIKEETELYKMCKDEQFVAELLAAALQREEEAKRHIGHLR